MFLPSILVRLIRRFTTRNEREATRAEQILALLAESELSGAQILDWYQIKYGVRIGSGTLYQPRPTRNGRQDNFALVVARKVFTRHASSSPVQAQETVAMTVSLFFASKGLRDRAHFPCDHIRI